MTIDALVNDIIKTGIITLVSSRICKSIGEKDISEIISGAGICVMGVDAMQIIIPVSKSVSKFFADINSFFVRLNGMFGGLSKGLKDAGILDSIINFGAKKW